MRCTNILNLYFVLALLYEVEGWSCTSPIRKVFTTTGTNAVLLFTADLSNLNSPRLFYVKFYDNTVRCSIRYNADRTYTTDAIKGVSITGDTAGKVVVTLQNVQQNSAGVYFTTSAGFKDKCNCLYILGVPTKPVITINRTPSVGDTSLLTCSSTSTTTPSNHSLTMVYNWRVDNDDNPSGTKYSYSTDRKSLYISNIVKEDANKQLTCTAGEDVSDGYTSSRSDDFSFYVYYGPENVTFSPSDTTYEREENSILSQITCKASCHPTCSFKWTKVDQVTDVSNTAVLDLGSLSASKAGTYICTASRSNSVTQSKNLTVTVIYGPENMTFSPSDTTYKREENSILSPITCKASCHPTCSFKWTKVGQVTVVSNTAVLDLGSLSTSKAGTYICTASRSDSASQSMNLTVNVLYGPKNMELSPSNTTYERGENSILNQITCKASCHPTCSFRWTKVDQVTDVSNTAVLDLGSLSVTKAGTYICTATRSNSAKQSVNLTVNVIYGPRNMFFNPSTLFYRRDENFNLPPITCGAECWSCGYIWTGPYSYSTTGQVLDLPGLTKSMAGNYTCTATNTKLSPQRQQDKNVLIEVRYGPDSASLTPGNTIHTVDEGSTLSDIKCEADCFPACKYKWTKEGQNVSNTDTLSLGQVEKMEAGRYTCRATNGDDASRWFDKTVTIEVRYGPYKSSTNLSPSIQQYTMNEDQILQDITCFADCFPNCTYTWTKTKQGHTTTVSYTDVLSLASLHRDEAATYTCTTVNPGKSVSPNTMKQVTIQVRYGPDVANINVHSPYYIMEGDKNIEIKCSSDCFPGCSYSWSNLTSSAMINSNNGVLFLSSVTRYMTGNYSCDSNNTASQYTKTAVSKIRTVVRYAPDVTIQGSEPNTREGGNLTLFCEGSGVPSNYTYISLTQFVNGVEIQNSNTEMTGTPKFSSIQFSSLTFQDTGTYTCTLNNGINDIYGALNQVGARDLLVKVKPNVLKDDLHFTGSIGATIDILIPIYSYPKLESLTITRYDGMDVLSGLDYVTEGVVTTTFYGKAVSLNGSRINMTMIGLKEEDFGNYTFTLENALGTTDIVIFIIAEGPPSPPKVFQFLSEHSIPTFLWERNFNGGLLQSFVIQISVAGTDMWKNYTNIIETDKQYQINSSFHSANISDLQPGVYTARILAYNTEGESETVHLISTFEVKKSGNGPTSAPIAAIAGGTTSAIVVIAIVAVVLFMFKRRSKNKDGSRTQLSSRNHDMHDDDDDDDDEDEVNTVNPMYVSADEVQSTDNTYAQPIKKKNTPDANNVYAVVDKKKTKDKTENIKKKKNKKVVEGDIYENAPDSAISMKKMKTDKKQAYDENPYENPESSVAKQPKRFVNQDGLIYVDLAFNDQPKGQKKLVIHGLDSMTEYVEVDFTKRADPLPDSDEEDNKNKA